MNNNFLRVENLQKSYGEFLALDNFSCEIPTGVTGLLGPNGAGKTTFLRCLLGVHEYSSGKIHFLDYELPRDHLKVKDLIGYQPENETKIPKITAMRYVVHMGRIAGLPGDAAKQRAFDTLHYVGLGEARYRPMDEFSQGMLQKVKLATALVHDPLLLIADEPTAGCDPESRQQILNLIHDLGKNYGKNIIISTHLLPDIEKSADYVVVVSQGKLIAQGTLQELLNRKKGRQEIILRVSENMDQFAKILEKNMVEVLAVDSDIHCILPNEMENDFRPIFQLAKQNKIHIRKITPHKIDLEEVFLDVVKEAS